MKFIFLNMTKTKLLVVEDDPNLGSILAEYLELKGYDTLLCRDGVSGFEAFRTRRFHMCILDVMMPKKDGFALAQEIREINSDIPIIFLTARSMKEDTIKGFKIGADDYITKPFSMEELLLRVTAVLKRTQNGKPEEVDFQRLKVGNSELNIADQTLYVKGKQVKLTPKESALLQVFFEHKNKTLSRTVALKSVWGDDSYFNARSMDVYVTKLRKHLKDDDSLQIMTVHGEGFKLLVNQ